MLALDSNRHTKLSGCQGPKLGAILRSQLLQLAHLDFPSTRAIASARSKNVLIAVTLPIVLVSISVPPTPQAPRLGSGGAGRGGLGLTCDGLMQVSTPAAEPTRHWQAVQVATPRAGHGTHRCPAAFLLGRGEKTAVCLHETAIAIAPRSLREPIQVCGHVCDSHWPGSVLEHGQYLHAPEPRGQRRRRGSTGRSAVRAPPLLPAIARATGPFQRRRAD